jgi:exopolysaccharide biosynthesis polyprenyl glycosylphosphotransferase
MESVTPVDVETVEVEAPVDVETVGVEAPVDIEAPAPSPPDAELVTPGRVEWRRIDRRRFARTPFVWPVRRTGDVRDIREGERTPVVLRRDARIRRTLALADVVAAAVALAAAVAVDGDGFMAAIFAAPLFMVPLCKLGKLYERDEHVIRKTTLDQAPALLQAATIYTLMVWLASEWLVPGGFERPPVAALWVTLLLALLALRVVARRVAARLAEPERVLVLGGAQAAERLRARLEKSHSVRAVLIGRVALGPGDRDHPLPLGPLDDLDYMLRKHHVERVIIAPHQQTSDEQLDTIRLVKGLGVKVSLLPRLFEVVGSSTEFDDVDGITLLGLRRYGLSLTSWYVKRTFDLVVASIGIVVLSPLLLGIAAAVKLSSPGPVLFRQPRVGRRGKCFQMLKFRTMYDGADAEKERLHEYCDSEGLFKLLDDPRVTPVGRVLRRTSLDELPQLWNVIRGEMSLVGPRPLIEEEDRKIAGWHHRRREGTPGMTGVWQVLGSQRVPLDDMVKMDYLYRADWSLWLDVKILLRTFAHVCSRRGM